MALMSLWNCVHLNTQANLPPIYTHTLNEMPIINRLIAVQFSCHHHLGWMSQARADERKYPEDFPWLWNWNCRIIKEREVKGWKAMVWGSVNMVFETEVKGAQGRWCSQSCELWDLHPAPPPAAGADWRKCEWKRLTLLTKERVLQSYKLLVGYHNMKTNLFSPA